MSLKNKHSASLCIAGCATAIYLYLFLEVGIVDRETAFTSWMGLPTASTVGYRAISYFGVPVFLQFQGLGYRLPLVSGIVNSPISLISHWFDTDAIRSTLLLLATFLGSYSFARTTYQEPKTTAGVFGVLLRLICVFPLIAVGFGYTVTNDWSDVAFGFWGGIITVFTLMRLKTDDDGQKSSLFGTVSLLCSGLFFVSISYPWNWTLYIPITLGLYGALIVKSLRLRTRNALLLTPLVLFLILMFAQSIDIFTEYISQTKTLQKRMLEGSQLDLVELLRALIAAQIGWLTSGRELYLAALPIVTLIFFQKQKLSSLVRRTEALIAIPVFLMMLTFSWLADASLLGAVLPSTIFAFRDFLLPLMLLWTVRAFERHSVSTKELPLHRVPSRHLSVLMLGCLMCYFLLPIGSLLANVPDSMRLDDAVVDELNERSYRLIKGGELVYVNRGQWLGTDVSKSNLGPRQLQGAGIASLNVISKMRSNDVLEPQKEVFEGGLRDEHCLWNDSARFLHVSYLVGAKLCESLPAPSADVTKVDPPQWVNVLSPMSQWPTGFCSLIHTPCISRWKSLGFVELRDVYPGEYFRRCKSRCVANLKIVNPGTTLLLPLKFDTTLVARDSEEVEVPITEFSGLVLLDTSNLDGITSIEITVSVDSRMKANAFASYLKLILVILSLCFGLHTSFVRVRNLFLRSTSFMKE